MTRKDFELIAKAVKNSKVTDREASKDANEHSANGDWLEVSAGADLQHKKLTLALADSLATTNPLFDKSKFLQACGH